MATAGRRRRNSGHPSDPPSACRAGREVSALRAPHAAERLQVIAVLHHEQPVVSMRIIVRAGASLDPSGKLGLGDACGGAPHSGHDRQSANEINDAIDFIGGAMDAGAGAI